MQSAKWPPAASYTQIIVRQKHYDLNQFAWYFVAFKFLRMAVVYKMHVRKKYVASYILVVSISVFTHHFNICAVVISCLAKTRHTLGISVNSYKQAMK